MVKVAQSAPWARRGILGMAALAALYPVVGFAANGVAGDLITFNTNGGWCWFEDPRVIVSNGQVIVGSIAGTTANGASGGDVRVSAYDLNTRSVTTTTVATGLGADDHNAPSLTVLPDGRYLLAYQTHGADNNVRWRVSSKAGDTTQWAAETRGTVNTTSDGNGNTYANLYYLSIPNKVYNFSRAIGYDPNYSVFSNVNSTNNSSSLSFSYGGHWMYWKNPNLSGQGPNGGNGRPYVKYASNGTDTIWFATTEDSPDNYWNSLYCGYIKFNAQGAGTVYKADGTLVGPLSTGTAPTTGTANNGNQVSGTGYSYLPTAFSTVFSASKVNNANNNVASWASSITLDRAGQPHIAFTVRHGDPSDNYTSADLRYYYASWNGSAWDTMQIAYAGKPLYSGQNNYSGLISINPVDTNMVYISTDVDPATGEALFSVADGKQHWEIYKGLSSDDGQTWVWTALTPNSTVDNIRPIVTAIDDTQYAVNWMRGTYTSYTNYNTSVVGIVTAVPEPTAMCGAICGGMALLRRVRGR